jgi:hypothetical protein
VYFRRDLSRALGERTINRENGGHVNIENEGERHVNWVPYSTVMCERLKISIIIVRG